MPNLKLVVVATAMLCLVLTLGCNQRGSLENISKKTYLIALPKESPDIGDLRFAGEDQEYVYNFELLVADLTSDDWKLQLRAAKSMGSSGLIRGKCTAAIPGLINLLESDRDSILLSATNALYWTTIKANEADSRNPELESAIDPLIDIVSSSKPVETRLGALGALEKIALNLRPKTLERVVPFLINMVDDSNERISRSAIDALGCFGSSSAEAVPILVKQLDLSAWKAHLAAGSLGRIRHDPGLCVPALVRSIDKWPSSREWIAEALGRFGPEARDAVPSLVLLLADEDSAVKRTAAFSLSQIGNAAESANVALEREFLLAKNETFGWDVRLSTLAALCAIGADGEQRAIELAKEIEEFAIGGVGFVLDNPVDVLNVLTHSANLKRLDLGGSEFSDEQLAALASMEQLEELILPNETSNEGLKYISGLERLRKIEQKRYGTAQTELIGDEGLGHLERLHGLRTLYLTRTNISDLGLAQLRHFPQLETLYLSSERITDDGMPHLSELKDLRELSLARTNVGDEGVSILADNHPNLTHLDMFFTEITSACVDDLSRFKKLKFLGVFETPLNGRFPNKSDATKELERALPNCKVYWID